MKNLMGLLACGLMLTAGTAVAGPEYVYGPVMPAPAAAPGHPTPVHPELHYAPAPVAQPHFHAGPALAPIGPAAPLWHAVDVEDRDNIHPCAVEKVITLKMRHKKGCSLFGGRDRCDCACGPECVSVVICVPPCECVDVDYSKDGSKVKYDYGKYEVEVEAKNGVVKVDYDD